jgi:integrase
MDIFHTVPFLTKAELTNLENDPFYHILCTAQVGKKKRPFKPSQVIAIFHKLCEKKRLRDLVLFTLGIDMMSRCSDIITLKVDHVMDSTNRILEFVSLNQQKTDENTGNALMPITQQLLKIYVQKYELKKGDYLFSGRETDSYLCARRHRYLIKEFAKLADLPPEFYSTHSMRGTKSILMYMNTKDPAIVMHALGQKSLTATKAYLGVEKAHATHIAKQIDFLDISLLVEHGIIEAPP